MSTSGFKNAGVWGLERWLGLRMYTSLEKNRVWIPAPTWARHQQPYNSSFRGSDYLWGLVLIHTPTHKHMQEHIIKIFLNLLSPKKIKTKLELLSCPNTMYVNY